MLLLHDHQRDSAENGNGPNTRCKVMNSPNPPAAAAVENLLVQHQTGDAELLFQKNEAAPLAHRTDQREQRRPLWPELKPRLLDAGA
jgi:hypothetical protein